MHRPRIERDAMCPGHVSATVSRTDDRAARLTARPRPWAWIGWVVAAMAGGAGESARTQSTWIRHRLPEARAAHALAYDSARGRVALFGGNGPSGLVNDT